MNYRVVFSTIGRILLILACLLVVPFAVALVYREGMRVYLTHAGTIIFTAALGNALCSVRAAEERMHARDGLVTTGLTWIIMSFICALPLFVSGQVKTYLDALFEIVSGFTTTGMSVIDDPTAQLTHSMLFLRSFTHWIGGMGVLVFVLAVLPDSNPTAIHLMKQESPGPQVSKLVSKVRSSAMILYAIYVVMTFIMIVFLLCGGMPFFDSIITAFGAAGTGGFSLHPDSIAHYNSTYIDIVTGVFMLLFGVNFNVYYLILIGKGKEAFRSEELKVYACIVGVAVIAVTLNSISLFGSFATALNQAFFHVSSIITTTGYTISDINKYSSFSKAIMMLLMFSGACSGSTCGGIKIIRSIIVSKSVRNNSKSVISPREVNFVKVDGKRIDESIVGQAMAFLAIYVIAIALSAVVIYAGAGKTMEEAFSVALSSVSNIGAQFNRGSIALYPWYCKIVMIFDMLLGRLEVFPIIMLFMPKTWRKV